MALLSMCDTKERINDAYCPIHRDMLEQRPLILTVDVL